jgi:hypothetical protein
MGYFQPNFADRDVVLTEWYKMFPSATQEPPLDIDCAQSLVFWLSGFTGNVRKPISGGTRVPLFHFESTRVSGSYPHQVFFPNKLDFRKPYVFFDTSRTYSNGLRHDELRPYVLIGLAGQKEFQIICAGADNDYGHGGVYPTGGGFAKGDDDNLANFGNGLLGQKTGISSD